MLQEGHGSGLPAHCCSSAACRPVHPTPFSTPSAGELDFQADEAFLEAMMAFVLSIPAADVWQDDAWEARQRRLLTAQFGPNEVPSRRPRCWSHSPWPRFSAAAVWWLIRRMWSLGRTSASHWTSAAVEDLARKRAALAFRESGVVVASGSAGGGAGTQRKQQ